MFRLIVLGFAGFGMYKVWELVGPKISAVRDRATGARERIEPAIREAADTLQSAAMDVAEELTDGVHEADPVAPDPFGAAAERVSPAPKLST